MEKIGKAIDALMGKEQIACLPDDPQAKLLLEAGIALLPNKPNVTTNTRLQELGEPSQVRDTLKNLESLYITDESLANDILNNALLSEVITHLEANKVNASIAILQKKERQGVIVTTQNNLAALKNNLQITK